MTAPRYGRAALACAGMALAVGLLAAEACPDTLDVLVVTSAAADLGSTEWALRQPGIHEANPLWQGPPERAVAKLAGTVAILGMARYLERHRRPGWSKAIRVGVVVLWGGVAVSNVVQGRRAGAVISSGARR